MIYEQYRSVSLSGVDPERVIRQYLSNGTPVNIVSGTASSTNLIGNYSATPVNLDYTPPSNEIHLIHELIVYVKDAGTLDTDAYGNSVSIANGINISLRRSGAQLISLTEYSPIRTNSDWFSMSSHVENRVFGTGDEFLQIHIDFTDLFGGPIRLIGSTTDTLRITLSDNYTGLNVHSFKVRGIKE